MGDSTKIEWTGATWNPVTGCAKVSQGCKNCYAERDWARLVHLPAYQGRAFTDVECHPERLYQPIRWKKPRRIFVNSMSDLFHEDIPDEFIDQVFAVMALAQQNAFQVLTKRPRRMCRYIAEGGRAAAVFDIMRNWELGYREGGDKLQPQSWPLPNVHLGVSIEDQPTADERTILLLQTPAAVRWISAEPLLGPVSVVQYLSRTNMPGLSMLPGFVDSLPGIDWVVAGGEFGPKARPTHPDWFRSLRDQCAAAGVPYLLKQIGEFASVSEVEGVGRHHTFADGATVRRVGKKAAGRLLDGVLHDEYPVH